MVLASAKNFETLIVIRFFVGAYRTLNTLMPPELNGVTLQVLRSQLSILPSSTSSGVGISPRS